ncbi:patatin-like phospholipase family protein [Candidatus Palauibacter soopunensis]|uniref:patatin-like phospholipase family protein n=1 Tax=Candidatus Palauibacter soopunensis TaxID=3056739 RepID=UPI0023988A70|nr:patatin-like phospholipase family protein [Candidatus Palauibacter soopunensis]MDE2878844.1 patatin-like phospholipase family protein [Candidatus Palauibacter soopunensis]
MTGSPREAAASGWGGPNAGEVLVFIVSLLLLLVVATARPPVAQAQEPTTRPRVGLALGGGAARGLAHVGVLEWLEEHRIPVDAIAGTSVGGLVGGSYAAGRTALEVRDMVADIDWDRLFRGDVEYGLKSYRRKEDRRGYPVRPEFGWRDGPRVAQSLDPGHEVELLLSRVALPHVDPIDFDDLPIPFRAVATDLEGAAVAELGSGSLASALRATMSIPGVFHPVERDGLLLADGGLLNNVPADVVSRMGVDVVIAVNVGAPLATREDMRSLVNVAGQAIGIMMTERSRSVMSRHADHILAPPVQDISAIDWRRFDTIRAIGYRAAAEAGESLAYLSLSPAEWARHVEARRSRRPPPPAEPRFVRVAGVDRRSAEEIVQAVEPVLGTALDPDELELRLTRLAGGGRYGSLGYGLAREGNRTGIAIRARDKPHGPPFLNLALEVEDRTGAGWEASVGTRFTVLDAGSREAELRLDLSIGPDPDALLDYYLPVAGSPVFLAPRIGFDSRRQWIAAETDGISPSYRTRRVGAGADVGVALGRAGELRIGYEAAIVVARVDDGTPLLQDIDGREHGARVKFVYDGQDDWLLPRSGIRIAIEARRLASAAGQSTGFAEARIRSSMFLPIGGRGRVFLLLAGTEAFDDRLVPLYQSTLGGPFRLSTFERDEFRGVRTAYAGTGYLHQFGRLPDFMGGPIHGGAWIETGWIETGTALPEARHADLAPNLSAGLLVDTLLGALLGGASIAEGRRPRINIALGRPFW